MRACGRPSWSYVPDVVEVGAVVGIVEVGDVVAVVDLVEVVEVVETNAAVETVETVELVEGVDEVELDDVVGWVWPTEWTSVVVVVDVDAVVEPSAVLGGV